MYNNSSDLFFDIMGVKGIDQLQNLELHGAVLAGCVIKPTTNNRQYTSQTRCVTAVTEMIEMLW